MKSKKQLFEFLSTWAHRDDVKIENHNIDDETYGKRSFIYFFNVKKNWGISRANFENLLTKNGFNVKTDYDPKSDNVEVQVSYFKGHNWDK